jgi:hypothetical protein
MGPPGSFGICWFHTLPTVGGGWFGWSVLQASIEKSFAPMRNLLSSLFADSNIVRHTPSMKETASMIRSTRLGQLALGLVVLLAGSASLPAVDLYVLSNDNFTGNASATDFGRVDSATGAYTSIASLTGNIWNLAWNPNAGNFFATAGSNSSTNLRTLTTTGTLSYPLGTIGNGVYGMAYRTTNSTLYGYDYNADATGTINSSNGAWTQLNGSPGTSANTPLGGRYSIMNDVMYFAGNLSTDGIGTMGYTNTSTYQQIAANSTYANIVLANDGTTMYGIFGDGIAGNQKLYTINTATGAMTDGPMISGTGIGTRFHGAGIVPVPEPSTYALCAIATGVMAAIARRRKARRA